MQNTWYKSIKNAFPPTNIHLITEAEKTEPQGKSSGQLVRASSSR